MASKQFLAGPRPHATTQVKVEALRRQEMEAELILT